MDSLSISKPEMLFSWLDLAGRIRGLSSSNPMPVNGSRFIVLIDKSINQSRVHTFKAYHWCCRFIKPELQEFHRSDSHESGDCIEKSSINCFTLKLLSEAASPSILKCALAVHTSIYISTVPANLGFKAGGRVVFPLFFSLLDDTTDNEHNEVMV